LVAVENWVGIEVLWLGEDRSEGAGARGPARPLQAPPIFRRHGRGTVALDRLQHLLGPVETKGVVGSTQTLNLILAYKKGIAEKYEKATPDQNPNSKEKVKPFPDHHPSSII